MHNALVAVCGRRNWYEMPTFLQGRELEKVAEAITRLRDAGKPNDDGHVVAELTFGFWSSLLDARYSRSPIVSCINQAFPNMVYADRDRATMLGKIEKIRRLRNRVFHHEPIWHWKDLDSQYALVYKVLRGINRTFADYVDSTDRFEEVRKPEWDPMRTILLTTFVPPKTDGENVV